MLRFFLGAGILILAAMFFMSGFTPPGILGEVIRHNQELNIDASPFFYGDIENFSEIIEAAEQMEMFQRRSSKAGKERLLNPASKTEIEIETDFLSGARIFYFISPPF